MDKLLDEADKAMKKGVPGYVGATRMICKSYWDFKSVMVFDSVPSLEGMFDFGAPQARRPLSLGEAAFCRETRFGLPCQLLMAIFFPPPFACAQATWRAR